jgi:MYXO-CTERM domain-containing protein
MRTMGLKFTSTTRKRVVPRLGICCTAIALCCMAFATQSGAATIVDFDHIDSAPHQFSMLPSPYEEDGVVITNTSAVSSLPIIAVTNTMTSGTPYVAALDHPLNLVLTASDPEMGISLDSINLIEFIQPSARTFTFYGTRFDDNVVSESVSTDGVFDIPGEGGSPEFHAFTTLSAEPFKSIAVTIGSAQLGIDNIAVRLVSPTSAQVPEPATCVTAVLLGLGGFLGLRRRR